MQPNLAKTPKLVQRMFPKRIWAFPKNKNSVYLTFDDGPIPKVTLWVLDLLKEYNAKATFFCIGENIAKNPNIFRRILTEGHTVGNHTFNHLNGWETDASEYIDNFLLAETEILKWQEDALVPFTNSKLFRPPYGKIKSGQSEAILKKDYRIIMWDVLSYDFDPTISEEKCFLNVSKNIQPGSIVVFHDSVKAEKNLRFSLPKVLKLISEKGWECKAII